MIFFELEENSGGRGLPEKLPDGERILWQGAPSWRALFLRMFHARLMAAYFALLIAWHASSALAGGAALPGVARGALISAGLGLVPLVFAALYSWGVQRTTVYTVTDKRLVMSYGVTISLTINLPFSKVRSAGLKLYPGGAGNVTLQLLPDAELAYFMIWPHARPWHWRTPEPMLRGVAGAEEIAGILARALSAEAGFTPRMPVRELAPIDLGLVAAE